MLRRLVSSYPLTSDQIILYFISSPVSSVLTLTALVSLSWCQFCSYSFMKNDNAKLHVHILHLFPSDSWSSPARPKRRNSEQDRAFNPLTLRVSFWLIYSSSRTVWIIWLKLSNEGRGFRLNSSSTAFNHTCWYGCIFPLRPWLECYTARQIILTFSKLCLYDCVRNEFFVRL